VDGVLWDARQNIRIIYHKMSLITHIIFAKIVKSQTLEIKRETKDKLLRKFAVKRPIIYIYIYIYI
jgi:hypothetical protein